jgi:hypothetical protein
MRCAAVCRSPSGRAALMRLRLLTVNSTPRALAAERRHRAPPHKSKESASAPMVHSPCCHSSYGGSRCRCPCSVSRALLMRRLPEEALPLQVQSCIATGRAQVEEIPYLSHFVLGIRHIEGIRPAFRFSGLRQNDLRLA